MKIQKREGSYKSFNVYKSTKDEIHNLFIFMLYRILKIIDLK